MRGEEGADLRRVGVLALVEQARQQVAPRIDLADHRAAYAVRQQHIDA